MDLQAPTAGCSTCHQLLDRYCSLTGAVLELARRDLGRFEFLWRVAQAVLESSVADELVWWLREPRGWLCCSARPVQAGATGLRVSLLRPEARAGTSAQGGGGLARRAALRAGPPPPVLEALRAGGGVWCAEMPLVVTGAARSWTLEGPVGARSVALVPLVAQDEQMGYLELRAACRGAFGREEASLAAVQAQTIALAAANQRARRRLRERIKELDCLYELVRLANSADSLSLQEVLRGALRLLPPGWQHPGLVEARIELDGQEVRSPAYRETELRLSAPLVVRSRRRGVVEVVYRARPTGPGPDVFLPEEVHLLQAVASEVAGIVERREERAERGRLQEQLRHADRLASLGQLAAGMAHELNEPLASVLGFAELAQAAEGLPEGVRADLGRIVSASLRARDIVRQLRLFARQGPERRERTELNLVVKEAGFLMERHCARQGVTLRYALADQLPPVLVDGVQIHQVLTNLAFNAVHAMPGGGSLTLSTGPAADGGVLLRVADTGSGMSAGVLAKALLPFYTTKGPEQGTGLGLSVVDGIVRAHGGSLQLRSQEGEGTEVLVVLPAAQGE